MRARLSRAVLATLLVVSGAQSGSAQEPKPAPPSNPVGGPAWNNTKVTQEPQVAGITLDAKQIELVKSISGYFNEFPNLRGAFVQTAPDNKRMRGKFFVKRPGRLRFEYSLPSKQLIIADGKQLAVQDHDLNTDDRYALDQTLFRMLLRQDVDLLRDARILDVQEADDLLIVSLQDKSPDAPGKIRLFLTKAPRLELKEWVMTDAQGTDTRVELSNLVKTEEIDVGLFKIESPSLKRVQ